MATLDSIADEIGYTRNELMQSMVKFGLTNRDWRNEGLTAHKRLPRYQENPMATKPPSAAQLAARKRFAEMARNGSLNRKRQIAAKKRKANPDGLYDNINAKRERIAAGSGERMRRPGTKGAPTDAAFKRSAMTARKSNPAAKPKKQRMLNISWLTPGGQREVMSVPVEFTFTEYVGNVAEKFFARIENGFLVVSEYGTGGKIGTVPYSMRGAALNDREAAKLFTRKAIEATGPERFQAAIRKFSTIN
jgi:hypothetical protein